MSQDYEEHNSVVDENDIHYDRNKYGNIEEEISDGGGTEFECLF